MAGSKQSPLERSAAFQPPWRERNPDGSLGEEYGPSPSTLARRIKAHRMWTWRPASHEERRQQEGKKLDAWLSLETTTTPPKRELDVYVALYLDNLSTRAAAKVLNISRDSVREYKRRLLSRMERASNE